MVESQFLKVCNEIYYSIIKYKAFAAIMLNNNEVSDMTYNGISDMMSRHGNIHRINVATMLTQRQRFTQIISHKNEFRFDNPWACNHSHR